MPGQHGQKLTKSNPRLHHHKAAIGVDLDDAVEAACVEHQTIIAGHSAPRIHRSRAPHSDGDTARGRGLQDTGDLIDAARTDDEFRDRPGHDRRIAAIGDPVNRIAEHAPGSDSIGHSILPSILHDEIIPTVVAISKCALMNSKKPQIFGVSEPELTVRR